jgi:hypothetical protein
MTEYQIQPPTLRCARTGRELKTGESYYSVLRETPQGFAREDYALEAWQGPPENAIGFWRATVAAAATAKGPPPIDNAVIAQFFEHLAGEEDATKQNFRFILALLLLRRKVLKLAGQMSQAGRDILVLRATATGQEHRVVDPGLTEEQLARVQAEVSRILQNPVG